MDEQEIARLRELASKATPKYWTYGASAHEEFTSNGRGIGYTSQVTVEGVGIFWDDPQKARDKAIVVMDCIKMMADTHEDALTALEQRDAEIARLREALEWYADEDHYDSLDAPYYDRPYGKSMDLGATARAALKSTGGGDE